MLLFSAPCVPDFATYFCGNLIKFRENGMGKFRESDITEKGTELNDVNVTIILKKIITKQNNRV